MAVALFALLFGVIQGSEDGWGSAKVIGSFMLAAVFAVPFVLVERRSAAPLLRLDLFSNRIFVGSAVVTVIGMSPTSARRTPPASGCPPSRATRR